MAGFNTRLVKAMVHRNISSYKLAKDCGLSPTTISNWISGSTKPDKIKLELVCKYLDVNLEWLLTGVGNMRGLEGECFFQGEEDVSNVAQALGSNDPQIIAEILNISPSTVNKKLQEKSATINQRIVLLFQRSQEKNIQQYAKKLGIAPIVLRKCMEGAEPGHSLLKAILDKEPSISSDWLLTGKGPMLKETETITLQDTPESGAIPYYSDLPVSAGERGLGGIPKHEKPSGWIKIPGVIAELGAFPVVGCSMEPNIHAGDFIAVSAVSNWDRVDPDKTYLIITLDERMIKHLMIDNEDTDILWCISPNYPKFKIYKAEIKFIYKITFHGKIM